MHRRINVAGLFLLLAGTVVIAGQTPSAPAPQTPTFKTRVEYVEVDALVTDQQGQFVRDLTKDDFQVTEDGKRQTISNFTLVDIPIERAERPLFASRPIEPDVQTNEHPFDGRVYVMILDDLHVAALRSQRVKIAARQFIERNLGANDLMAVIFTGGRSQDAQEFTSNKRLLINAVDKFMGQKLDSPTIARNREYFQQVDPATRDARIPDPEEQQRVYNTRSMLSSLRQVGEWFGAVRGRRKSMLLISEGIDYDISDIIRAPDQQSSSAGTIISDIQDAIAATARSNVSIYTIDPRGLATTADDTIGVSGFADQDDPVAGAGIGTRGVAYDLRVSQDSLRQLADETGGFAAVNRNDFTNAFDRIVRDNSSYYVLAYYPPSDKRDGKFHRIDVKVTRPGLVVRSRRGYNAPRGKAAPVNTKTGGMPQELFEAINSPLQVSGLTMRVFASPFKGAAPNASVLLGVELLGRDLSLEANSKVEVSFMAIDSKSKVFGARNDALTMNLRPDTKARVEQSGLRVLNRIDLPPGRYQVRVAARDSAKTNIGTVVYDLEVPDFYKQTISLSGIALTSLGGAAMMTAKPDDQLKTVLPAPPVAARTFAGNDELAIFAEVYDNTGNQPHKVDIVARVLTDEGRELYKSEESHDSSELQGAKGGYGYAARIPLSEIPPGTYVLNVEARSRLGNTPAVAKEILFKVVSPGQGN